MPANGNPQEDPQPDYPGFTPEEVAAAALAAAARDLAYDEREMPRPETPEFDPIRYALSKYLILKEHGYAGPEALVEVIMMSYFDAAGQAIAMEMGAEYAERVDSFVHLAWLDYIKSRIIPAEPESEAEEDPDAVYAADPEDQVIACWEQGAE